MTFHFMTKLEYGFFIPFLMNIDINLRIRTSFLKWIQYVLFLLLKFPCTNSHENATCNQICLLTENESLKITTVQT